MYGYDVCSYVPKFNRILIKEAIRAVIGVGKNDGSFDPSPLRILLFAFLVASLFLGTVALLLIFASIVT